MSAITSQKALGASIAILAFVSAQTAFAQDTAPPPPPPPAADDNIDITVTGWRLRELDLESSTASRLGLSLREIPATVDQISAGEILTRGFRSVEEATVSLPGITSGGTPGSPSLFSMRGFTADQITVLKNGLYLGPANMVARPGNTFNIEGIDVLKGPASVLFGQGAIGGAVNVISKVADFKQDSFQALGSYGSFETFSGGMGGNRIFSDKLAARVDASYHRSAGYVENTPSDSFNVTGSVLWKPSSDLSVEFAMDYLKDNLSEYFGTPLVPASFGTQPIGSILSSADGRVIDRRTQFVSYNVADARSQSQEVWPRINLTWTPSDDITVTSKSYYYHAEREWINAEQFVFNPATNLIDRDRFFVFHNQDLSGTQLTASFKHSLFGLDNTFLVGLDYSHLDFVRSRGFPDGDSVDPFNPAPGTFGPLVQRVSPTRWDQGAIFMEDVLSLTPELKLITGLRSERMWLTRENFNVAGQFVPATSFKRIYKPFNVRAGLVYDIAPSISMYASYSSGKDPVGSNIFLVNAAENFGLSSSRQFEIGLKADAAGGRATFTIAAYNIKRKNILTLIATDTLSNVGSQKSQGIEVSAEGKIANDWTLIGSATYVDAKYGQFVDPNYGIDATGNAPPNVPKFTASIWTTVRNIGGLPLEVGGGLRYVDDRFSDSANSVTLKDYVLGIVYATVELSPNIALTGRVNNVFNKAYAQWGDIFYPNQVTLGEPRRFEISALARF